MRLHQSGKLHRDIKPTNVLVTPEGRVVLLDFGLTADLESSGRHQSPDRQIVGTVAHMSPEQAAGLAITPASDWYSVGVMLYEALTGRLPFDRVAPGADHRQADADASLAGLAGGRAAGGPGPAVRRCCWTGTRRGGRAVARSSSVLSGQVPELDRRPRARIGALPLIGRSRHLHVLDAVFAASTAGRTESIFVFGRTGTGKTTLIRSFLDGLIARDEAVVLSGRCYERESVPYKALDSLIDALARHLKGLPARKVAGPLARRTSPFLARVFPVLQSVEAVASARVRGAASCPTRKSCAAAPSPGSASCWRGWARRTALVLAIDDLQWGDVDSAILLSDLLCSPQSPVLLFLGSFRTEDAERSPFLNEIRKSIAGGSAAARPSRAGRRAADPVRGARAGPGPARARRCRVAGPGARGGPRVGRQPAVHRRAGQAHPRRRADRSLGSDRPARPGRSPLGADPTAAGGGAAAAGRRGRLGAPDPAGPGLPGQPTWAAAAGWPWRRSARRG